MGEKIAHEQRNFELEKSCLQRAAERSSICSSISESEQSKAPIINMKDLVPKFDLNFIGIKFFL